MTVEINWLERRELLPGLFRLELGKPEEREEACCLFRRDGEPFLAVILHYEHSTFNGAECLGDYAFLGFVQDIYVLNLLDYNVQHWPLRGYFSGFYRCGDRMLAASACDLTCFDAAGKLVWESQVLGLDGVVVQDCDNRYIRVSGEWDPPGGWVDVVLDAQTGEKIPGFYIGGSYYCRMVPGLHHPDDYADWVDDIHYEADVWLWTAERGMHRPAKNELSEEELAAFDGVSVSISWKKEVEQEFGQYASLPSWVLARMWYLSSGTIRKAIETIDGNGEGSGDGGTYYFHILVEDSQGGVAVLEGQGDQALNDIFLSLGARSERMKAPQIEQFFRCLHDALLADVRQLAACRVVVKDFEKNGLPFEYGWDGKRLLE